MLNVSRIFGKAEKRRFLLAVPVFVAFGMLWVSASQAQVYLPSDAPPQATGAPIDADPDLLKSLTDYAGGGSARSFENCGGDSCTGILLHRLDNLRVEDGNLKFDYQIRAGQPAGAVGASISETDKPNNLGNAAPSFSAYIAYSPEIFGDNIFSGCTYTPVDGFAQFEPSPGFVVPLYTITKTDPSPNVGALGHIHASFISGAALTGNEFIIPFDQYFTVAQMDCPIANIGLASDGPANVAFSSVMLIEANQRTGTGSSNELYASIAGSNHWYYPLDGKPAIIDVEVGGSGDHFYIDVTFSEGVSAVGGGAVGEAQFADAVHIIARHLDDASLLPSGSGLAVERVTRPGGAPVQVGDTVVRVKLENPASAAALAAAGNPNVLVSTSPTGIIATDDGAALHSGPEWWVRAWYDHRAPYIVTAEIGPGNAYVDIAFEDDNADPFMGVKFEVSFDADDQAVMTGTRAPEPEDFEIWFYDRSAGSVEPFTPASVTDLTDAPITVTPNVGVTTMRLGIPQEIIDAYEPGDTIDIRTAQRQKDQLHPSLASVFVFGTENLSTPGDLVHASHRKNSKFATAVGDTNFPRTAAFAQVGSLALKRTLGVAFDPADELRVVLDDAVEVRIELIDAAPGDAVTVSVDWMGAQPPGAVLSGNTSIELSESAPVGTFTVTCAPNACTEGDTGTLAITVDSYKGDTDVAAATLADGVTLGITPLPVSVVREIPVEVMFTGDPASVNAPIDGQNPLEVTLDGAAAALGQSGRNDRITVAFAVEPAGSGVTVSPGSLTFDNSGNPQTITLSAGADAMTQLTGLTLVTSATPPTGTPVPVGFTETRIPLKVVPSFAFQPATDDMTADEVFAGLITPVSGSQSVLNGDYTIVPGAGAETKLDVYAPVTVIGDVYVCVKGDGDPAGRCDDAANFILLSDTPGTTASNSVDVAPFTNEVHWAAVAGTDVEPLGTKMVYVAPPVGFQTDIVVYSGSGDVNTGLIAAVDIAAADVTIAVESTTGAVASTVNETVSNLGPESVDAYSRPGAEEVLRITALEGVTFKATDYTPGSADINSLIMNNTLLSIGNDRVELRELPPAESLLVVHADDDMVHVSEPTGQVTAGFPSFKATLPSDSELTDVEIEVTVTVHQFSSSGTEISFAQSSTPLGSIVSAGQAVSWGDFTGVDVDSLPANSFIEVSMVVSSPTDVTLEGGFRLLVVEATYTEPTGKTPVPGAYAQAEVVALSDPADDLTLQSDGLGIENPNVSGVPSGVFDYLVANLGMGEVVSMVLPLEEAVAAGFAQQKFTAADGWDVFVVTDFDRAYSAPAPCPSPNASREVSGDESSTNNVWRLAHEGTREGDRCVLLQLQEGGVNDADRTRNGILHDPTALLPAPAAGGGSRRGGGGAMEPAWLILLAAGMLLSSAGLRRRRHRLRA